MSSGRIDDLHRQLDALENRDDELIRFVGHHRPGHHHFKAVMVNRHVQTAIREGRTHGLLDSSWARPQQHRDLGKQSGGSQEQASTRRFPISLGFVVIEMIEPDRRSVRARRGMPHDHHVYPVVLHRLSGHFAGVSVCPGPGAGCPAPYCRAAQGSRSFRSPPSASLRKRRT